MNRIAFLLPMLGLSLSSCQDTTGPRPMPLPSPPASATDLLGNYRQLVGSWLDSTSSDRYTIFEAWQIIDDSTLVGNGYALAGKDTVFVEELRLEVRELHPIYSARIGRENLGRWVPFQAEIHGRDSLIFQNPGHDFPQRISYLRDGKDRWRVVVSGTENGIPREDRSLLVRR